MEFYYLALAVFLMGLLPFLRWPVCSPRRLSPSWADRDSSSDMSPIVPAIHYFTMRSIWLKSIFCKHQSVFNVYISCLFARPSDPCQPLSLVAMVSDFLLSCVIFGEFYLALFVELANRIFSQFIKTWSKLAKSRGKSFTILFQSQINLWNKENFNQINLQNFAAWV